MITKTQNTVEQRFSRAAATYDQASAFHRRIAKELIAQVVEQGVHNSVLDIGMGTGWMTRRLKALFPEGSVVGADISPGMLAAARRLDPRLPLVLADAQCLPFAAESFDGLVSNLAYQWVKDLKRSFASCRRVLKKGGGFYFSIFGRRTFQELFSSLQSAHQAQGPAGGFFVERLADEETVREHLLNARFARVEVSAQQEEMLFDDLFALIRWIKALGGNALNRNFYPGKDLLASANEHYQKNFSRAGGVSATLEIIWARGVKE